MALQGSKKVFLKRWAYSVYDFYRLRLTEAGRGLLWVLIASALAGLDTQARHIYIIFSIVCGLFLASLFVPRRFIPNLSIKRGLPLRLAAGEEVNYPIRVRTLTQRPENHFILELKESIGSPEDRPRPIYVQTLEPGSELILNHTVRFPQRGVFYQEGVSIVSLLPFGLIKKGALIKDPRKVVVYPKVYPIMELSMTGGRRYHSGGIVLASSTGDTVEFYGTREYQQGDPIKKIHWPSWARTGKPIVKEYQEEYFVRHALILDTFMSDPSDENQRLSFEGAISLAASIASHISLQDFIIDIFAAGPKVYYFSAGRSLAHLDDILEILATIEPSTEAPFLNLEPTLMERLSHISSILVVLIDLNEQRRELLLKLKLLGVPFKVVRLYWEDKAPGPPDFLDPDKEYRPISLKNLEEEIRFL